MTFLHMEAQQEVVPSQTKRGHLDSSETDPVIQINPVGIVEELVKLIYQGLICIAQLLVIFSFQTDHERILQRGLCFLKQAGLQMTY